MATRTPSYPVRVGTAGWSLPKEHAGRFPAHGTHLVRYAARLPAVEINSSFYRPHRPSTYAKWAASVTDHFRFSVKVPKVVTHERRLVDVIATFDTFLAEATELGEKAGPLLVQLPPSLAFSDAVAREFFRGLRDRYDGEVAFEPRHASWFDATVEKVLTRFRVARVAADPAVVPAAAAPGGWGGFSYYRLHGSPRTYYSAYSAAYLDALSKRLAAASRSAPMWCIFDNTALGAAAANALHVLDRLEALSPVGLG